MNLSKMLLCLAVLGLALGCSKKDDDKEKVKNTPVVAFAITPVGDQKAEVEIQYTLVDPDSDTTTITVEYSTNGGVTFELTPPTEWTGAGSASDGTTGLTSGPFPGVPHIFVWDTLADLGMITGTQIQFRITPFDTELGLDSTTASFTVANALKPPPSALVTKSISSPQSADVTVDYTLYDLEYYPATITVERTTDFGGTWLPATEASVPASEGTTGLATAPPALGGAPHVFVWDSQADVGNGTFVNGRVAVRITPEDYSQVGSSDRTNFFDVDNAVLSPPTAMVFDPTPGPNPTGNVSVSYMLLDADSDRVDITSEFSTDSGATWFPAARGPGGDGVTNLTSSPGGTPHTFVWNTLANVGATLQAACRIRITPADGTVGTPGVNPNDFVVDNQDTTPPQITLVSDAATVTLTQRFTVEFDEPMDPASAILGVAPPATVAVVEDNDTVVGGNPCTADFRELTGTLVWENQNKRLVFYPDVAFVEDEEVRVCLTSGITDVGGNGLTPTNPVMSAPLSMGCLLAAEVFESRYLPGGIPECLKYLPDLDSDIWYYDFDTFGVFDNELQARGLRSTGVTQNDLDANDLARQRTIARVLYILHDRYGRNPDTGAPVPGVSWKVSFVCSPPPGTPGRDFNRMCVGTDQGSTLGRAIYDVGNTRTDDDCSASSPLGTFSGGINGTNSDLSPGLTGADLQFLDGTYQLGTGSAADDQRLIDIRAVIDNWGQAIGIVGCHETGHSVGLPHDDRNSLNIMKSAASRSFLSSPDTRFGAQSTGLLDTNLGID